uniref:Uncharacterized protein n=1 Tax=Odontella aurita TaxID=265563 RepID=A0A7S4JKJ1_9STRA
MRLLLLLLLVSLLLVATNGQQVRIPSALLAAALNHASHGMGPEGKELVTKLTDGNLYTLYRVAKSMYDRPRPLDQMTGEQNIGDERSTAVRILHILADAQDDGGSGWEYVPASIALGLAYSEHDKPRAIRYFQSAGNKGPHQMSLYNAGRLLVEMEDFASALGHMRKAAVGFPDPKVAAGTEQTTATAKQGYEILSLQLAGKNDLSVQQMADIFPYADLDGFPKTGTDALVRWAVGMNLLEKYNKGDGEGGSVETLIEAKNNLVKLLTKYEDEMSALQANLLKRVMERIDMIVRKSSMGGDEL